MNKLTPFQERVKQSLIGLIGKSVRVSREEHPELTFNIAGILEDGDPDEPGTKFYCRCKEDFTGTSGIEFSIPYVEEIQTSVYDSIIWIK